MEKIIIAFSLFFISLTVFSQTQTVEGHKVGKAAAARYFADEKKNEKRQIASDGSDSKSKQPLTHYMSLGFGTFADSTTYGWGESGSEKKVGRWGADLSYRFEEQNYLFDQMLRVSYNQFLPEDTEASKLSVLYALVMPEAGSEFPLYFGTAAGFGAYVKQISHESLLSFDYQLYVGLRTFNVFGPVGFYVEGGLRNHLHLLSNGQFNGTFLSLGSIFTF